MFLSYITIENFRAIKQLSLPFEETTVLIGENGSGKTSFFDALNACLGVRPDGDDLVFDAHDFRLPRHAGEDTDPEPIRIRLTFEEREPGEWLESWREILEPAITVRADGRRCIQWEVRAVWNPAEEQTGVEWCFLDADGKRLDQAGGEALVSELRRLSPFLLFNNRDRSGQEENGAGRTEELEPAEAILHVGNDGHRELERVTQTIYEKVSESWEELSPKDMKQARAAAKQIWKHLIHTRFPQASSGGNQKLYRLPSGGAQSLGPLLVLGAVLRARGSKKLDPEAEPIFGMEQIGAYLHPSTLGSVRKVLDELPAQKILSTYSGEMVAAMPLRSLRRIVRRRHGVDVYRFRESRVSKDDRRRLAYHIRARRGGVLFDRCWLLVEGETEFWLMPEMARLCGYEFDAEGVGIVEFAQCGVRPILLLARDLGIDWHLLADGDSAGESYVNTALEFLEGEHRSRRITELPHVDVERYLWSAGYKSVYRRVVGAKPSSGHGRRKRQKPSAVIERAIRARSKPFLALSVLEACRKKGSPGVPPVLRAAIEAAVLLARAN